MGDLKKMFAVTEEAAEGKWFDLGDGVRMKIAKAFTERHRYAQRKYNKPYENFRRVPPDAEREIAVKVIAEAILLDWEGVTENGESLPCTQENKIRILHDLEEFRNYVMLTASHAPNFMDEDPDPKN